MKILLLSSAFPHDPEIHTHGVFNRLRTLVAGTKHAGAYLKIIFYVNSVEELNSKPVTEWELQLGKFFDRDIEISFVEKESSASAKNNIFKVIAGGFSFYKQPDYLGTSGDLHLLNFENELNNSYDLIVVHRLNCMPPLLRTRRKLPRIIFDLDDIEHIALARQIKSPPFWRSKFLLWTHIPALILSEIRATRLAESTLICSKLDKKKLARFVNPKKISVLQNSVQLPTPSLCNKDQTLLFLGSFGYLPNVAAIEYMLIHIWPLVLKSIPDAKLIVGGLLPERISLYANPPTGVIFSGYIPSLEDAYASARAVVCPVLSGGGTRVKIVEAACYERAIISTSIGAEGLDFVAGNEILIGDSPASFAEHCIAVLKNYDLALKLGKSACLKASAIYDKNLAISSFHSLICG